MRTYDEGGQSPPYVVTDGTDTITMRSADPSATDMSQLETVAGNTTPGHILNQHIHLQGEGYFGNYKQIRKRNWRCYQP